jgi:hypothetical protein
MSPRKKTHFKAAKEVSMSTSFNRSKSKDNSPEMAKRLLKETQYDREKHLENILNNSHYECFSKLPIL